MGAVSDALKRQYAANIELLSQQLMPKMKPAVYNKFDCAGEAVFQNQLMSEDAEEKGARNENVKNNDPIYQRRAIFPRYFYKAPLVDNWDKINNVKDPTSAIVVNNAGALARAQDTVIIGVALATVYGGKTGTDTFSFASGNQIVHGSAGLTPAKLRSASQILNENEVPEEDRYIAVTAEQIANLLADSTMTSADYMNVKNLVEGKIDTVMGFKFIRSERLTKSSTTRSCIAWHKTGLCLGIWQDAINSIDILPTKHFSAQIYSGQSYGATRLEEAKVVEIQCTETA